MFTKTRYILFLFSLLEEADRKAESLEREGLHGGHGGNGVMNQGNANGAVRRRPLPRSQDLNKNGPNLSCLLTQMNPDIALKTHSLYEIGGNIGKYCCYFLFLCLKMHVSDIEMCRTQQSV